MKETDLKGTGLVEPLYHYLWEKDKLNNAGTLKVNLPDTIIYRNGKPAYWYFTAKDGGVRRRCNENLNAAEIMRVFTVKTSGYKSDIIAVFMYAQRNVSEFYEIELRTDYAVATKAESSVDEIEEELKKATENKKSRKVIFEYLNKEGLEKFLKKERKEYDGVLQRFIEPKGEYNCIFDKILIL